MDPALTNLGWTEEQWNRICTAVTEEAQKGRVAAQLLPTCGPEDASTVAIPSYRLGTGKIPAQPRRERLQVDSNPTLHITTIAVNVPLRSHEMADPELTAALGMFRRAANYIARIEDALVFSGRPGSNANPTWAPAGIPSVYDLKGDGAVDGLLLSFSGRGALRKRTSVAKMDGPGAGNQVVNAIIDAINQLDAAGQLGPYACALGPELFKDVCTPTGSLVLPRDRVLPFLQGPLLRASSILPGWGVVVALSASPVEIVVARDIDVRYLQTTEEPRYVFRVSERVALRIKEDEAIGVLFGGEKAQ